MLKTLINLKAQRDGLQSQMYAFTARIDALHEEIQTNQDRFDLAENQLTLTEGGIQTIEHLLSGGSDPGEDGPGTEEMPAELSLTTPPEANGKRGKEDGKAPETPEEEKDEAKPQTAQERRAKEKA